MIKDNSNNPTWPLRKITKSTPIRNAMNDTEPYAQQLELDCGHWLINTYGDQFTEFKVGQTLRCRTCGVPKKF